MNNYEDFKEEFDRANPQLTFGKVILKARKEKGWSQKKAAELIEISPTYLSKLEKDNSSCIPRLSKIFKIAELLDLDAELLYRLAGQIPDRTMKNFKELMIQYQKMPLLLRRMHKDRDFARKVFYELNEDLC